MAIKVIGVDGPRAVDDDLNTQDLLWVNHPTIPFGTIGEYAKLQKLLEQQPRQSDQQLQVTGLAARTAARVLTHVGRPLPPAIETLAAANNHILGETFHSMAAIRYGEHVAKISAAPRTANVRALTGKPVRRKDGESALRDLVADFFTGQDGRFTAVPGSGRRDGHRGRLGAGAARTRLHRLALRPDRPDARPVAESFPSGRAGFGPGACAEQLLGRQGIAPVSQLGPGPGSPLLAYRWADTDGALTAWRSESAALSVVGGI
jgi:hypothetical protein